MPQPFSEAGDFPEAHPIEFRRLQIFANAARSLSFAQTAKLLSLTPSAVSHAIRSLEEELSCILFERHGPKIILTHVGSRILPIAEDLLSRTEGLRREVSLFETESSKLRIHLPEMLAAEFLPKVLPDFFECFPTFQIETNIEQPPSDSMEPATDSSPLIYLELDAAISGLQEARALFDLRFQFYVAPYHSLASPNLLKPTDLAGSRFLFPHTAIERKLKGLGVIDESSTQSHHWTLPSLSSVQNLAASGMGIAVLNEEAASPLVASDRLKPLSVAIPPIELNCSAWWPSSSPPTWAAEVLLNLIAELKPA